MKWLSIPSALLHAMHKVATCRNSLAVDVALDMNVCCVEFQQEYTWF